eukprot:GHVN01028842.1.p1 GENE.GHVN01028842.1~~GHVN01028842.1.p1  ORF type:complete len:180 (-),score=15.58 GHVN01028842.1:510-1049(-)
MASHDGPEVSPSHTHKDPHSATAAIRLACPRPEHHDSPHPSPLSPFSLVCAPVSSVELSSFCAEGEGTSSRSIRSPVRGGVALLAYSFLLESNKRTDERMMILKAAIHTRLTIASSANSCKDVRFRWHMADAARRPYGLIDNSQHFIVDAHTHSLLQGEGCGQRYETSRQFGFDSHQET